MMNNNNDDIDNGKYGVHRVSDNALISSHE